MPRKRLGAWQLLRLIHEGGFANVYRACPTQSAPPHNAHYAVKVLRESSGEDDVAVAALRREVAVARTVQHRHLAPVLSAHTQHAPYYLVMPWLEGMTLRQSIDAGIRFSLPHTLWIVRQVAESLEALAAGGWMHGDVKPTNIHVSREGHVTLLDLGLARRVTGPERSDLRGTCRYMAPEATLTSRCVDLRSDLYSLGVVLFEMLTGRPPFAAEDLAVLLAAHHTQPAPALDKLVPNIPGEVARLVRDLLAKQPLRRPQHAAELIERLTRLEICMFGDGIDSRSRLLS